MANPWSRRDGLPTPNNSAGSLVGEVNARVKSKPKHENRPDEAESILRLGRRFAAPLAHDRLDL